MSPNNPEMRMASSCHRVAKLCHSVADFCHTMADLCHNRLALWVTLATLFFSLPSLAQAPVRTTPLPPFTGDKVIQISGIEGNFESVIGTIADVEKTSQQSYWVVIIRSAGPGNWATRDYANQLAQKWKPHIDIERSVVIVLCVDERALAIHAGTVLQDRLGLQGQRVDREIVKPFFIPLASELDYPGALNQLIPGIEQWITIREQQSRVDAETAKRRQQRVREEAARHLLTTRDLIKALRADLKRYPDFTSAGAAGLVTLADDSESQLAPLATRLKVMGSEDQVLAETLALEQAISNARKNVGEIVSAQSDAALKLEALEPGLRQEEAALQKLQESSGVPIASASTMIDEVDLLIGATRKHIAREPIQALTSALNAERALEKLQRHRTELISIQAEVAEQAGALKPKLAAYQATMAERKDAGLRVDENHARELEAMISTRLDDAVKDRSRLSAFHERADQILAESTEELSRHRTKTRTVPLAALGLLLLGLLGAAIGLLVRKDRWKKKATGVYEPYNREVVDLLDELDHFKRRHELLPFSNPDFTEPISGKSLELYQQLESRQEGLRQDWVQLMDKRALAEDLVETKTAFSPQPYREVVSLLERDDIKQRTQDGYAECINDLQKLEEAHESSKALLAEVDDKTKRLTGQLGDIEQAKLSTAPYEPEREALEDATEHARETIMGDPLGTGEALKVTSERLSALGKWTETILSHQQGCTELRTKLDAARKTIDKRRAEGLLLVEEEGNPDPIWEQGDAEQRETVTALDGGDHEMAEQHLHSGFGCWEESLDRIKRQQEARAFCAREIPALSRELERLDKMLGKAEADQKHLEASYDPASWTDVAKNFSMSDTLLKRLEPLIAECKESASAEVQQYFHAADLVIQAQRREHQTNVLLGAISDRREAIDALAPECMRGLGQAESDIDTVDALLRKHHRVVSKESLNDFRELRNVQEEAEGGTRAPRPHWPRVKAQLAHVTAAADELRGQMKREIAAHEAFRSAMQGAEGRVGEVARFLGMHRDDRALANRVYRDAAEAYKSAQQEGRENHADWLRLIDRTRDIEEALTRAETLGKKDVRLAAEARSAMKRANADIAHARSYHREGVSADTTDARSRYDAARKAYREKDYEESVQYAVNASRSANQSLATAEARARAIRRRQDELRRRRELARRRTGNRSHGGGYGTGLPIQIGRLGISAENDENQEREENRKRSNRKRGFRRSSSGTSESSWGSGASQSKW